MQLALCSRHAVAAMCSPFVVAQRHAVDKCRLSHLKPLHDSLWRACVLMVHTSIVAHLIVLDGLLRCHAVQAPHNDRHQCASAPVAAPAVYVQDFAVDNATAAVLS